MILLMCGLVFVILAFAVAVLLYSLRYEQLWHWYAVYNDKLEQLKIYISNLDKEWQFIGMILLLFIVKSFFPIYPTSTVCFLTGVMLPMYLSVPVNIIGISLAFTLRYFIGRRFGAGSAWALLRKTEVLDRLLEREGIDNPLLLVFFRLIPFVPFNSVSSIYGSYKFGYLKFLGFSVLGFLPKLISFTFVGRNIYDPLSPQFLVPVMVILFVTGFSLLSINGIWLTVAKILRNKKNKKIKQEGV